MNNKHLITFIVGGSGTGKSTAALELVKQGFYEKAITCTTRKPRKGESNFVDYVFLKNKEELYEMYNNNELIESPTCFSGNWYGCPLDSVYRNHPVVVVIEYEGLKKALDLLKSDPNVVVAPVFLEPLSAETIKERMIERGSTNIEIQERLDAMKVESSWGEDPCYVLKIKQDPNLIKEDSIQKTVSLISNLISKYNPQYSKSLKLK
jgi:guanylate kinase